MLTLLLLIASMGGAIYLAVVSDRNQNDGLTFVGVMSTIIFGGFTIAMLLVGATMHHESLKLEGYRERALTATAAMEQSERYAKRELRAEGNLFNGKIGVRYGEPRVRETAETEAIKDIKKYNQKLGEMKALKSSWLWWTGWAVSSRVDKMRPIDFLLGNNYVIYR